MKFDIRSEKEVITNNIKDYIISKLQKLEKYIKNAETITARVLIKMRGYEQVVEVTIPLKKIIIRAEEAHTDVYAAIDLVLDKLERQIRKNKGRLLASKLSKDKIIDLSFDNDIEEDTSTIIKRKVIETKPMSEEDAILEMNLLGHDFFVFKDRDINRICVIYKRKDGNYGIIET